MKVQTIDNPGLGRFELHADEQLAGFATYSVSDGVMTLPHTEVQPRLRGRGLASILIRDVLGMARQRGLAVLPSCPFVSRYIAEHLEYLPLVPTDQRARFGLDAAANRRSRST
jgi:predicted GNAT family acetyltransferase